jgi:hypothetical protein
VQPGVRGRCGRWFVGGILTYAANRLYEEVAYVAYHFHWSMDDLMDMDHRTRARFVDEIAAINRRLGDGGRSDG